MCPYKRLGDAYCNLNSGNLTSYRYAKTLTTVTSQFIFVCAKGTNATGDFDNGILKATSGNNNNIEREIHSSTVSGSNLTIIISERFPYDVSIGDTFQLEIGCDRTWVRCKELGNQLNYGGFPHVPGETTYIQIARTTT
jgi:uncharacterized phage protein (TIGR02218 family)